MIAFPNLLVAKIFKARHFKHMDIMEAGIGVTHLTFGDLYVGVMTLYSLVSCGKLGMELRPMLYAWIPSLAQGKISSTVAY